MILGKGLPNLGNTCYINTILQCLRYTKHFVILFKEYDAKEETNLIRCFIDLLYSGSTKKTLNSFIHYLALSNCEFKMLKQGDAHELYLYLIDTLYTPMSFTFKNVFKGCLQSVVECKTCQHKSITKTPFISLSVPMIPDKIQSVKELVNEFCKEEILEERIQCDKCNQRQISSRKMHIFKKPDILVIHVKRFQGLYKITTPIIMNTVLTLQDTEYKLYSICNHVGSVRSGHYTAACKRRDNTWLMCNDDRINNLNSLPTQSPLPYILFYSLMK